MDTRMKKYLVVCYHSGRLDGKEKKQANAMGNNVDESHKSNAEGTKPSTLSFMALSLSQVHAHTLSSASTSVMVPSPLHSQLSLGAEPWDHSHPSSQRS